MPLQCPDNINICIFDMPAIDHKTPLPPEKYGLLTRLVTNGAYCLAFFHHLHLTTLAHRLIHLSGIHTFLPSKYPASQIFCHSHIFLLGKGCPAHLRRLSLLLQLKCLPEPHWKRTSSLPVMLPSLRANSRLWRQQYLKSACKFAVLATNILIIL